MAEALQPAVFLDRDGVINEERNYVHRIEDFHLLPGVVQATRRLADAGYALVVVTNQAGVAKGYYTEADYEHLTRHLRGLFAAQGVLLTGIYHCPHHPDGKVSAYRRDCDCRKPAPGMILQAARDWPLDLRRSFIVGDKLSDIDAGKAAGVGRTVLVRSGHGLEPGAQAQADHCCDDLPAAVKWILDNGPRNNHD